MFALFLLFSPIPSSPCFVSSQNPSPCHPSKVTEQRNALCSRDLGWNESGKTGPIYLMGGLGSRCCQQQRASGNEDSWRTNSILPLLSCPFLPPTISGQMSSRAFEVTKRETYIFPFFQPSVILKVKWYYSRIFLVPYGRTFKCWATPVMNWDFWNKSSLAWVKFPCVSFVWAMHLTHKLVSFWLVNLEEMLDLQDRGQVRQW